MLRSYLIAASWYLLFGTIHELSHVCMAKLLILFSAPTTCFWRWEDSREDSNPTLNINWIEVLLHRRFEIDHSTFNEHHAKCSIFVIRQFGWIASFAIASMLYYRASRSNAKMGAFLEWCHLAAYATALDALCTDLFQLEPFSFTAPHMENNSSSSLSVTFYCGNFGVILLHAAWLNEDGGQTALHILRKMIEVTMMRGAQSGGIVTFERKDKKGKENGLVAMRSIRSRVVKSKRGDL